MLSLLIVPVSYTHLDVYKRQVLGRAGKNLGVKFSTPIVDGASLDDVNEWTDKAGLPRYGKTTLYDGCLLYTSLQKKLKQGKHTLSKKLLNW